jgi:hypothetical protein
MPFAPRKGGVERPFPFKPSDVVLVDVDARAVDHAFEPRPALDWEQLNAEYVFELRWWRIDDIVAADHLTFAPAELGRLLDHLHQHGPPTEPTDISV